MSMSVFQSKVAQDNLASIQLEMGTSENGVEIVRRPFDPISLGLEASFRLTKFADLKGRGFKVGQDAFLKLLNATNEPDDNYPISQELLQQMTFPKIGIGMDCSVVQVRYLNLYVVQTTNFLYPVVDDPYLMGKIACANTLSNMYAMGVVDCNNILMLLGVSFKMTEKERDSVVPIIMRGFRDCALEAGGPVSGGQTVFNPWCIIGGVATSVCDQSEFIMPNNAIIGDVLVLTKPLGTQIAISAHQWLDQKERWNRIKLIVTEKEIEKAYLRSMDSMARLNRVAAKLMHQYQAHGATDISGYGLLAHAQILAKFQINEVSFVIHNLPVIAKMSSVAKACGNMFHLLQGTSPETSGGLLICLPREQAASYCKDIEKQEGYQAWIIGVVEKGNRTARIIDKPRVIEVPFKDKEGELW